MGDRKGRSDCGVRWVSRLVVALHVIPEVQIGLLPTNHLYEVLVLLQRLCIGRAMPLGVA